MQTLFSDDFRRDPYPLYAQFRAGSPLWREPQSGLWLVFDYDGVKRVLADHDAFSSRCGYDWMLFTDPPRHARLRALVAQAFTPRVVANLEPRIRELSSGLLDKVIARGELDLADDYAVPLPMMVIGRMIGVPPRDQPRLVAWSDVILNMSYTLPGGAAAAEAANAFAEATGEMDAYLEELVAARRAQPEDDLLTRLVHAEVEGERLTRQELLGFFQLLLVGGQETTTNLINNAVLSLLEHPEELQRLKKQPDLLPSAIEEVLRYRAPLQWMFRITTRDVAVQDQTIPAGQMVLALIGSANRDPRHFEEPDRFRIDRDPNPHLAFGHGIHFCLGAPLARLEARIALTHILERLGDFQRTSSEPWQPRAALHVLGPAHLPLRFRAREAA